MLLIMMLAASASGATIVVDDDGVGDFATIQEAVNASEAGDVIIVQSGTYSENLVLDRPIVLKGEGSPIVKGSGLSNPLIVITSDNVTLEGFTFTGCLNDSMNSGAVLV
jgi:nitrous oxidase accessory protein NosD